MKKIQTKDKYYAIALFAILILSLLFKVFFFDLFRINSISMKSSLNHDDFVIVDKVSYGTIVTNKFINLIPFGVFDSLNKIDSVPYFNTAGFKNLQKGDIIIFKDPNQTSQIFVKRIIGLPGDKIEIINGDVFINNNKTTERPEYIFDYYNVEKPGVIKSISNIDFNLKYSKLGYAFKRKVSNDQYIGYLKITPENRGWTKDNYGPVLIPKNGLVINHNLKTYNQYYENLIFNFERNNSIKEDIPTGHYTFENDYYFVMGDNRNNSVDSRFFGLIPKNYIIGKVLEFD